jgi:hypothetical protein
VLRFDPQIAEFTLGRHVSTGCYLQNGDTMTLHATGEIDNGWWFSSNGPEGESGLADNRNYPLLGARKYALLAKTNGNYRYAGRRPGSGTRPVPAGRRFPGQRPGRMPFRHRASC